MHLSLLLALLTVLAVLQQGSCFLEFPRKLLLKPDSRIPSLLANYMSNEEMAGWLKDYVQRCGHMSKLSSFGRSTSGVEMFALEISNTPGQNTAKPKVKYVGNIHGDEPSGRQLLLALAEKLCSEYGTDALSKKLVDSIHLFIVPSMNPDGFKMRRRESPAAVDLNRNFPDPLKTLKNSGKRDSADPQPEVLSMMSFTLKHKFVASLAFHEGALVANYPLDGYPDGSTASKRIKQIAPDDASFVYLSQLYARGHTTMARSKEFPGGITNGAQWYPLYGGMQDWNYLVAGCMEITLELNDRKWPKAPERLTEMWAENERVLLEWALAAGLGGVRGTVASLDPMNNRALPIKATIQVQGIAHNVTTSLEGHYFRFLPPGQYTLLVSAPGYTVKSIPITVPSDPFTGVVVNATLTTQGASSPAQASTASVLSPAASPSAQPVVQDAKSPSPDSTSLLISDKRDTVRTSRPSRKKDSSSLASNQEILVFVGLQVIVIGLIIAWRKRQTDRITHTSNRKDEV